MGTEAKARSSLVRRGDLSLNDGGFALFLVCLFVPTQGPINRVVSVHKRGDIVVA